MANRNHLIPQSNTKDENNKLSSSGNGTNAGHDGENVMPSPPSPPPTTASASPADSSPQAVFPSNALTGANLAVNSIALMASWLILGLEFQFSQSLSFPQPMLDSKPTTLLWVNLLWLLSFIPAQLMYQKKLAAPFSWPSLQNNETSAGAGTADPISFDPLFRLPYAQAKFTAIGWGVLGLVSGLVTGLSVNSAPSLFAAIGAATTFLIFGLAAATFLFQIQHRLLRPYILHIANSRAHNTPCRSGDQFRIRYPLRFRLTLFFTAVIFLISVFVLITSYSQLRNSAMLVSRELVWASLERHVSMASGGQPEAGTDISNNKVQNKVELRPVASPSLPGKATAGADQFTMAGHHVRTIKPVELSSWDKVQAYTASGELIASVSGKNPASPLSPHDPMEQKPAEDGADYTANHPVEQVQTQFRPQDQAHPRLGLSPKENQTHSYNNTHPPPPPHPPHSQALRSFIESGQDKILLQNKERQMTAAAKLQDGSILAVTVSRPLGITRSLRMLVVMVSLAFFLTVALVYMTSGDLTAPLTLLAARAEEMGRGEMDTPVPPGNADEFGALAQVLEEMRVSIKDKLVRIEELNEDLEKKVKERTRELESAMEELTSSHERLVHSEKMAALGSLVAGVAHEINNPVNFIVNSVEPLDEWFTRLCAVVDAYRQGDRLGAEREIVESDLATAMEDDIPGLIRVLRDGADRTRSIVAGLRVFSRKDHGRMVTTTLPDSLDATINLMWHQFKTGGVKLVREFEPDLPSISANPDGLNQVFLNLLTNAVQAAQYKGELGMVMVRIGIGRDAGGDGREPVVTVEIEDNGPGVPDKIRDRIFEPFFTTKEPGQGTGLGLSISHSIVAAHGGSLELVARTDSKEGALFRVTLPVSPVSQGLELT